MGTTLNTTSRFINSNTHTSELSKFLTVSLTSARILSCKNTTEIVGGFINHSRIIPSLISSAVFATFKSIIINNINTLKW